MDKVIKAIQEISIKAIPQGNGPLQAAGIQAKCTPDSYDWKTINNIVELTRVIPTFRFYAGNQKEKSPSVIRCETYFKLLSHRSTCVREGADPRKIALKGIGKYSGTLSSGLLLNPEKSENVINGGNSYWYGIKNAIKQHMSCDGEQSQLHFDALQHEAVVAKRVARGKMVTDNLLRIAVTVIKSKSAGQRF